MNSDGAWKLLLFEQLGLRQLPRGVYRHLGVDREELSRLRYLLAREEGRIVLDHELDEELRRCPRGK